MHVIGLLDITTDLQMNKPRINLTLNRALADDLNINIRDLSDELLTWFGGDNQGTFNDSGYRYNIRLRAESSKRSDPAKVLNTLVSTMLTQSGRGQRCPTPRQTSNAMAGC